MQTYRQNKEVSSSEESDSDDSTSSSDSSVIVESDDSDSDDSSSKYAIHFCKFLYIKLILYEILKQFLVHLGKARKIM